MAVPWAGYILDAGFETGDTTEWSSKVDTQSKLSVQHYAALVRLGIQEIPFRGAYAGMVDLSLGTADAYVQSTAVTAALGATLWIRFMVYVEQLVMAVSDQFSLLEVQSVTPTTRAMVGIRNNGGVLQIYAAQTQGAGSVVATDLVQGVYHLIDLKMVVDSGAANGTITLFVDGYQIGAALTGLTQAAITQARFGAMGIDAGTTAGVLLLDAFVASTYDIAGFPERYPQTLVLTKSGHAALGPGSYMDLYLDPGGAIDNHAIAYDTDEANILAEQAQISPDITNDAPYKYTGYIASKRDGRFARGMYVQLTGTNPRAYVVLGEANVSAGAIRSHALQRTKHRPF